MNPCRLLALRDLLGLLGPEYLEIPVVLVVRLVLVVQCRRLCLVLLRLSPRLDLLGPDCLLLPWVQILLPQLRQ